MCRIDLRAVGSTIVFLVGSVMALHAQERIVGVGYGPFRDGQSPITGIYPTIGQMREDMPIIGKMCRYLRTYSTTHGLEQICALAGEQNLKVMPGIWLESDPTANDAEIAGGISVASQNNNLEAVIVGSEVLLRGNLAKTKLLEHISYVKQRVSVLVTTAEPWHIWRDNPDLVAAVDFIFMNIHPYWESQAIENAVPFLLEKYDEIRTKYPTKRIIISETGWPTGGPVRGSAVPSLVNQKKFVQELISRAYERSIEFFFFDAFDENWKRNSGEGEVGAHWGFYTSQRIAKHDFGTLQIASEIVMSKESYADGETVTATEFRLRNPGSSPANVELKMWLTIPALAPISILNLGSDGSFSLGAAWDQDLGPLSIFTVNSGFPRGGYEFSSRLLHPKTGKLLSEDLNPFTIQ